MQSIARTRSRLPQSNMESTGRIAGLAHVVYTDFSRGRDMKPVTSLELSPASGNLLGRALPRFSSKIPRHMAMVVLPRLSMF